MRLVLELLAASRGFRFARVQFRAGCFHFSIRFPDHASLRIELVASHRETPFALRELFLPAVDRGCEGFDPPPPLPLKAPFAFDAGPPLAHLLRVRSGSFPGCLYFLEARDFFPASFPSP